MNPVDENINRRISGQCFRFFMMFLIQSGVCDTEYEAEFGPILLGLLFLYIFARVINSLALKTSMFIRIFKPNL